MPDKHLNTLLDLAEKSQREILDFHTSGGETEFLLMKLFVFIIKAWIFKKIKTNLISD